MEGLTALMITLVDIDNVMNNFTETCVNIYNENYGTNYKHTDIVTYDIASCLGPANWEDFLNNYLLSPKITDACIPLPEAPHYLELINKICELYVVTARDWSQLINIRLWLKKYFPFLEDWQIIRCRNKNLIMGDILIDDCLDNILNFSRGRILFDYPYNREVDDLTNFITRVHSWQECYDVIKLKTA